MFLIDNEVFIRLGLFFGIFAIMALWEVISPRRPLTQRKPTRWANNLFLVLFNTLVLRLVFAASAVNIALFAGDRGWGVFNSVPAPELIEGFISLILLDLTLYTQHVFFHKIGLFWRLHRMHHTDLDVDVTTGARFHTVEILLSMGIKMGLVIAIGAPVWSVIVFEVLLNATSMFNHSNIFINLNADRLLRFFVVTPDMHRVHHSVIIEETNSNYGFNFPWWDRLFHTYRDQPSAGHTAMTIGLANYRDPKWLTFLWMLSVPLAKQER